jgi:hypothetical protein
LKNNTLEEAYMDHIGANGANILPVKFFNQFQISIIIDQKKFNSILSYSK